MDIALVTVATNRYTRYVGPLLASAAEWFFPDDTVRTYTFTNRSADIADPTTRVLPCPPWGFPTASLRRYQLLAANADVIEGDAIFLVDADMLFVGPVGPEILPRGPDGLTAVAHPGFWRGGGSWEVRPASKAYVPPQARRAYYAGGFQGGLRDEYLAAARTIDAGIDIDAAAGLMAEWHDESHWNAYLSTRAPLVLSPEYCYPDHLDLGHGLRRCLLALFKDHAAMRSPQ